MDFVTALAGLTGEHLTLAPCGCGSQVHFCTEDDIYDEDDIEQDEHSCHILVCPKCGSFDLGQGADPENKIQTLEELQMAIIPVWNRMVRSNPIDLIIDEQSVLTKAQNAGFAINLCRQGLLDFAADLASTVMTFMIAEGQKQFLVSCGFGIYEADGHFFVASADLKYDGLFVDSNNLGSAIETAYWMLMDKVKA